MAADRTGAHPKGHAKIPSFGLIIVEQGLATTEQVRHCLDLQSRLARTGEFRRLGEILVEEGVVTSKQVHDVLAAQDIAILVCRSCSTRYNAHGDKQQNQRHCPRCRDTLLRPATPDDISIEDSVGRPLNKQGAAANDITSPPLPAASDTDTTKLDVSAYTKPHSDTPTVPLGDGASLSVRGLGDPAHTRSLPKAPAAPDPITAMPQLPDRHARLGAYVILGLIGQGGMGIIYKAVHQQLGRIVALKVLSPGRIPNPSDVERFQREARAVAQFRHANIVSIHEVGHAGGVHYFAMDFIEGIPLSRHIDNEPLPVTRAVEILLPIAEALHYAHSRGIVHRDIKPSNIIVDNEGQSFLLDFGIAKIKSEKRDLTAGHEILGSAPYLAPEYIDGEIARFDERCDVYALGVVLYECLAADRPHDDPDTIRLLRKILYNDPVPLVTRRPDLDPRILAIVDTATCRDPAKRYPTAMAFADDLRRYRGGEQPHAPKPGTVRRQAPKNPADQQPRSGHGTALAAAALAAALAFPLGRLTLPGAPSPGATSPTNRGAISQDLVDHGRALDTAGDQAGALVIYGTAIRLDPEGSARAYARRGLLLLRMGRQEEGRRDLDTARALEPGSVDRAQAGD